MREISASIIMSKRDILSTGKIKNLLFFFPDAERLLEKHSDDDFAKFTISLNAKPPADSLEERVKVLEKEIAKQSGGCPKCTVIQQDGTVIRHAINCDHEQ